MMETDPSNQIFGIPKTTTALGSVGAVRVIQVGVNIHDFYEGKGMIFVYVVVGKEPLLLFPPRQVTTGHGR
jgi:hypothetical protein